MTPGPRDGAAERDQHGARLLGRAELAEPVGAEAGDQGDVGERLDVLDECRAGRRTPRSNGRGGTKRGLRGAAVQPLHERRLLAGDEALGGGDELDARCARPPRARSAIAAATLACAAAAPRPTAITILRAPTARGRGHGAVEHEMRVDAQEQRVLVARGLALDAVGDDDRAGAPRRPPRSFTARREAGAAAPAQPARLDRRDERGALAAQGGQRGRSARGAPRARARRPPAGAAAERARRRRRGRRRRGRSRRDPEAGREVLGRARRRLPAGAARRRRRRARCRARRSRASTPRPLSVPMPTPWSSATGQAR